MRKSHLPDGAVGFFFYWHPTELLLSFFFLPFFGFLCFFFFWIGCFDLLMDGTISIDDFLFLSWPFLELRHWFLVRGGLFSRKRADFSGAMYWNQFVLSTGLSVMRLCNCSRVLALISPSAGRHVDKISAQAVSLSRLKPHIAAATASFSFLVPEIENFCSTIKLLYNFPEIFINFWKISQKALQISS